MFRKKITDSIYTDAIAYCSYHHCSGAKIRKKAKLLFLLLELALQSTYTLIPPSANTAMMADSPYLFVFLLSVQQVERDLPTFTRMRGLGGGGGTQI
jgi:hypothetical protein